MKKKSIIKEENIHAYSYIVIFIHIHIHISNTHTYTSGDVIPSQKIEKIEIKRKKRRKETS